MLLGVALLPFVDEDRLKSAIQPYLHQLSEEEKKRNIRGNDCLFVHKTHQSYELLNENIYSCQNKNQINLMPNLNDGMSGKVWLDDGYPIKNSKFIKSPIPYLCADLQNNQVISVKYKDPQFDKSFIFKSHLLIDVKMPEPILKPSDWNNSQQYKPNTGFNRDNNYRQNRNSTVANRMLQYSLNIEANDSSSKEQADNCISSAYGGYNSNYYGSYRTNSSGNNNNNIRNNDSQQYRYQQTQQYGSNNNNRNDQYGNRYQQQRSQQYNNNYRPNNQLTNNQQHYRQQFSNNQQQYRQQFNNNNQRNYENNNNPVSLSSLLTLNCFYKIISYFFY